MGIQGLGFMLWGGLQGFRVKDLGLGLGLGSYRKVFGVDFFRCNVVTFGSTPKGPST